MFYKIGVLYDFSETSKKALKAASHWAKAFSSSLKIIHVVPDSDLLEIISKDSVSNDATHALTRQIEKDFQEISTEKPEILILFGHTTNIILETLKADPLDLIIMGTHGYSGMSRLLLGSVAEKTIRYSPIPVLVIREDFHHLPQSILAPIDFNDFTEELFLHLFEISKILNVTFDLVHMIPYINTMRLLSEGAPNLAAIDYDLIKGNAEVQIKFHADKHPSLKVNTHVGIGAVAEGICEKAKELRSDLILIHTHGYKGTKHLLLGSVAEQVVRYSPCSVLSFAPQQVKSN